MPVVIRKSERSFSVVSPKFVNDKTAVEGPGVAGRCCNGEDGDGDASS